MTMTQLEMDVDPVPAQGDIIMLDAVRCYNLLVSPLDNVLLSGGFKVSLEAQRC